MSATSFNTPAEVTGPEAPPQEDVQQQAPETQEAPPQEQQQEPILGKFQTQDDLIRAYQELESKLGQRSEQQSQEQPTEANETSDPPSKEELTQTLQEKGVEIDG